VHPEIPGPDPLLLRSIFNIEVHNKILYYDTKMTFKILLETEIYKDLTY